MDIYLAVNYMYTIMSVTSICLFVIFSIIRRVYFCHYDFAIFKRVNYAYCTTMSVTPICLFQIFNHKNRICIFTLFCLTSFEQILYNVVHTMKWLKIGKTNVHKRKKTRYDNHIIIIFVLWSPLKVSNKIIPVR